MFRGRRASRRAHGERAPIVAPDHSVRDAEEILRQAWKLELLRQRDRMRFALRVAEHDCDNAHEALVAAQHDGDPHAIATAHAALLQAVETACKSTAACERTARALRTELALLARASRARTTTAPVYRLGRKQSASTFQIQTAPGSGTREVRRLLVVLPSERKVCRWLRRLAIRRMMALGQR